MTEPENKPELEELDRRHSDDLATEVANYKDEIKRYKRLALFWFILITVAAGYGIWKNEQAVTDIQSERSARVDAQSSVNAFFCQQNNRQDQTLGRLVSISLSQGHGGFASGIDPSQLTPFDEKVLATFAKIQSVSPRQLRIERVFANQAKNLKRPTDCRALAHELAKASGTDPSSVRIINLGPALQDNTKDQKESKAKK